MQFLALIYSVEDQEEEEIPILMEQYTALGKAAANPGVL
jgi:hypothetical protein